MHSRNVFPGGCCHTLAHLPFEVYGTAHNAVLQPAVNRVSEEQRFDGGRLRIVV